VAPARAHQVAQGISAIVPLAALPHGIDTSISSADALGVIATTQPTDPVAFAVTLVHEWSHSLLNGMLNFVELHEPAATPASSYFVPWRPDPRPISGVLHGAFAFLAAAETWHSMLAVEDVAERATTELALLRKQLAEVLAVLPASPELTGQGRRFVEILRCRNAALMDAPLRPREVAGAAAPDEDQRSINSEPFST
jgi:HEXXH motif-containing protein